MQLTYMKTRKLFLILRFSPNRISEQFYSIHCISLANFIASVKIANIFAIHLWCLRALVVRAQWWNHILVMDRKWHYYRIRCGHRWTFQHEITIIGWCLRTRQLPFLRCPWCMRESIVFFMPSLRAFIMRSVCWDIVYANWEITLHWNRMNEKSINSMKSLN